MITILEKYQETILKNFIINLGYKERKMYE